MKQNVASKEWLKAAGIRALKTFAQSLLSMIAVGSAMGDINWPNVLSVGLVAAVLSILTSVVGLPEVGSDGELLIDTKGEKDIYRFEVEDFDELADKDKVVLKVNREANLKSLNVD